MLTFFIQLLIGSTVILVSVILCSPMLSRTSAAARHTCYCGVMIALLMLPLLIPFLPVISPTVRVTSTPEPTAMPVTITDIQHYVMPQHDVLSDTAVQPMPFPGQHESHIYEMTADNETATGNLLAAGNFAPRQKEHAQRSNRIEHGFIRSLFNSGQAPTLTMFPAVMILLCGMIIRLVMLIASIMTTRNLVRHSVTFELPQGLTLAELCRKFRLRRDLEQVLTSDRVCVPFAAKIFRPVVFLPTSMQCNEPDRLRLVLMHELAHIARHDVFWQLLTRVMLAVYWFHPMAWLLARHIRREREFACDDAVLLQRADPEDYASVLLDVSESLRQRTVLLSGCMVAMAQTPQIENRIQAILDTGRVRKPLGRLSAVLLVLTACTLTTFAGMFSPIAREVALDADDEVVVEPEVTVSDDQATTGVTQVANNMIPASSSPLRSNFANNEVDKSLLTSYIAGRLVDEDGKPLAGIPITGVAQMPEELKPGPYSGLTLQGHTDADGRFRFDLYETGFVHLTYGSLNHASEDLALMEQRGDVGDIVVKAGVRPKVRLLSPDGKPVPSVWVNLYRTEPRSKPVVSALSDANGACNFLPVLPGRYRLYVSKRPHGGHVGRFPFEWDESEEEREVPFAFFTKTVDIDPQRLNHTLQASESVAVTLRFEDERPEHQSFGYVLDSVPNGRGVQSIGFEDAKPMGNGVFRFEHVARDAQFDFRLSSFTEAYRYALPGDTETRPLVNGTVVGPFVEDTEIRVTSLKAPTIILRAADEHGKPVMGFYADRYYPEINPWRDVETVNGQVIAAPRLIRQLIANDPDRYFEGSFLAISDAVTIWNGSKAGTMKISGLQPNENIVLLLYDKEQRQGSVSLVLKEGEEKEITVTLKPTAGDDANNDVPESLPMFNGNAMSPRYGIATAPPSPASTVPVEIDVPQVTFQMLIAERNKEVNDKSVTHKSKFMDDDVLAISDAIFTASQDSVKVLLDALQKQNKISILTRPQITTVDQDLAVVFVGSKEKNMVIGITPQIMGDRIRTAITVKRDVDDVMDSKTFDFKTVASLQDNVAWFVSMNLKTDDGEPEKDLILCIKPTIIPPKAKANGD